MAKLTPDEASLLADLLRVVNGPRPGAPAKFGAAVENVFGEPELALVWDVDESAFVAVVGDDMLRPTVDWKPF